ncbi:MAG: class I SAM-dependent methyltransferase [Ruminococcaceae bacterium]|nr:class I SAM-dependent methyltransferase [Oscillospiraceae bacterium]
MTFEEIRNISNESERVNKIYDLFDESSRLNRSKAARVEFLTTVRIVEDYLKPGDRILDIGAGAGEYSFYFAEKGYDVDALELSDANIAAFRRKILPSHSLKLAQGNALDLSAYGDESFDIVLMLGPLYHLSSPEDRKRAIEEAKRVCKGSGKIFFAFITNDMIILTEFSCNNRYFSEGDYDKETFRLEDFPFVFATVDRCREMLADAEVKIIRQVAADGVSELLEDKINALDGEGYEQYLRYHRYICEKPEMLGMTNHLLIVGEK